MDVRGIKMSKKLIIVNFILVVFNVISLKKEIYVAFILLLLIMIFIDFSYFLEKRTNICKNWKKAPDLLVNDKRNYDILILGDKSYEFHYKNGLDLTISFSNLHSDYLILQRYYSLLKLGGKVELYMPNNKKYFKNKNISIFALNLLHPVTILDHSKLLYNYYYKWEEFMNPLIFIFKNLFCYNYSKINEMDFILLKDIQAFCKERGLQIFFYLDNKILHF